MTVVSALKVFCEHEKVPERRWSRAAELFGGDLCVRKEEAIVIDFAHAQTGPASADVAHLEVSLVFDAREGDLQGEAWQQAVLELLAPAALETSLVDPATVTRDNRMGAVVGQVRALVPETVANWASSADYMRVLAVYLLRHSSFPTNVGDGGDDEYRRTFAYWLACRLTEHLHAVHRLRRLPYEAR